MMRNIILTLILVPLFATEAFACSSSGNAVAGFFSIAPFVFLFFLPVAFGLVVIKWLVYRFGFGLKAFGRLALLHLLPAVIAVSGGTVIKLLGDSGAGSVSGTRLPVPEETSIWTDLLSRGLFVIVPVVILVLLYKGEKALFENAGITARNATVTRNALNFIYAILLACGGAFAAMTLQC